MAIYRYVAPVLLALAPAAASSQTIDDEMVNGYLAPVTVIENHPERHGAGRTAFELSLDGPDMAFDLRGVDGDNIAYVGGLRWGNADRERCYITQSRGVERTRMEIPYSPNLTQSALQDRVEKLSASLDFSGILAICQTPTDKQLLEGSWTVTLTVDGRQSRHDGEFAVSTGHYCRPSDDPPGASVTLTYGDSGLIGREDGPFERAASVYHLWITDIPVEIPDADGITIDLRTGATFFPVFEGAAQCPKKGCGDLSAWSIPDIGPNWWGLRQCN